MSSKNQNANDENWDMLIKSKYGAFDINLKDIWRYRDLILLFVRRNFVAKYKQTILGPLWYVVQAILTMVIYTVVFGKIANISTDKLPHTLFYLSGIVLWSYFSSCLNTNSGTFINNAGLFSKVYFPRLTIAISVVIANLVQFFIQLCVLVGFMIYFKIIGANFTVSFYILLLPVLLILTASFALGFGVIISSLTVKYRDLTNLISFGLQLWMYATPIVYPLSSIPEKYKIYFLINPMTPIVETFRYSLFGVGNINFWYLLYSLAFAIFILFVGVLVFNKVEKTFADTV